MKSWRLTYELQGHGKHASHIHKQLGLHKQCSNKATIEYPSPSLFSSHSYTVTSKEGLQCTAYPRYSDCHNGDMYFCSMWRSVGFLMSFAVVLEGMTIAAFIVLILGGKQKREQGWGFMATMAALAGFVQAVGMSIVVCHTARSNTEAKSSIPRTRGMLTRVNRRILRRTTRSLLCLGGTWIGVGICAQQAGLYK